MTEPVNDDPHDELDDDCEHMDAELDILTGRITCACGYTKLLTVVEFDARVDFEQRAQAFWAAFRAKAETRQ